MSPAYDLINTRVHVADTDFALDKGLFTDGFKSVQYKRMVILQKLILQNSQNALVLRKQDLKN